MRLILIPLRLLLPAACLLACLPAGAADPDPPKQFLQEIPAPPGRAKPAAAEGAATPEAAPKKAMEKAAAAEKEKNACGIPTCKSSWDEKKTREAVYSMKCDSKCERAAGPMRCSHSCLHKGDCCEECPASAPCGVPFPRKKLFKEETEKVEKIPKYEVVMVPPPPCQCCERESCCERATDFLHRTLARLCWW
jgi:hypothetical protein